jgi:hypothetical protein
MVLPRTTRFPAGPGWLWQRAGAKRPVATTTHRAQNPADGITRKRDAKLAAEPALPG